jgi:hypothetical protein
VVFPALSISVAIAAVQEPIIVEGEEEVSVEGEEQVFVEREEQAFVEGRGQVFEEVMSPPELILVGEAL